MWLVSLTGKLRLPDDLGWGALLGVAVLCGIGFTMSLFIGTLAFSSPEHAVAVRIGVLSGSLISALLGIVILRRALADLNTASQRKDALAAAE